MQLAVKEFAIVADPRETLSYRLQKLFEIAGEARRSGVFAVANKASIFLLKIALADARDDRHREITVEALTNDEYGDRERETRSDLFIINYRSFTTILPAFVLMEPPHRDTDLYGRCLKRIGGDFQRRRSSRGKRAPPPSASPETVARFEKLLTETISGFKPGDFLKPARL